MTRLLLSLSVLLAWVGLASAQGQLINGHRTMTGGLNTGLTTGSGNAYVLTLNPPLPGYVPYQCFTVLANHSNTGAATLNVNGRGAKAIKKWAVGILADLDSGDITSGQYVHVCYDGTDMQVQSGSGVAAGPGGGTGDVTSLETSSTSGVLTVFAGTTGKVIQAYEGAAGLVKTNGSGVPTPAVAGTDYVTPAALTGKQDAVTWGAGLQITATTANVASQEPGFLSTGATLLCGVGQAGKAQVTPGGEWQYCGAEPTPLLHSGLPTQQGLTWNVTPGTCTGDASGGKLTILGSQIICGSDATGGAGGGSNTFNASDFTVVGVDVSLDYANAQKASASQPGLLTAADYSLFAAKQVPLTWGPGLAESAGVVSVVSAEPGFLTLGTVDLTDGGGAGGKMQVRTDGSLEYTDAATPAVRWRGRMTPQPFTWNVGTGSGCKTDANLGKLTINASDQIVCTSDVVGEGGVASGDITAVGNLAAGDAGTTGAPLTNLWVLEAAQPSPPATGQGVWWLDNTSKNFSVLTSDGVVRRLVQSVAAVPHQVLTALAPDGAFSSAHLASANLSDGSALARLTGPQILTGTQVVPRSCTLSAATGTVSAPNADLCDVFERHDVGGPLPLTIPAPTASGLNPRPQHPLTFSLCAAAAQTVVWDNAYATRYGVPLPTTIPAGGCVGTLTKWNTLSSKWETWGATPDSLTNVAAGGTGVTTLTGLAIGNGTSPFTAATSSTVGQTVRVTGANTYGFGALDLANAAAVTNVLPNTNTTATSANTASAIMARDSSGNVAANIMTASLAGNATTATALQADLPYTGLTPATAASRLLGRGSTGAGDWQEVTLGTNLSMSGTTLNATGGGSLGTGTMHLFVGSPKLPVSAAAIVDSGGNFYKVGYDETISWCAWWQVEVPKDYVGSPVFEGTVSPVGSTTGSLIFDVSVMAVTAGDTGTIELDDYDTVNTCTLAAIPTVAGRPGRISCALTNNDSMVAEDGLRIKVCRNVSDTAVTRMNLSYAVVQYAR